MLAVKALEAGYGAARVLFGVELALRPGEVVTLMGRNGMGKTTTVKAIMGLVRPSAGSVSFEGKELAGSAPFRVAKAGIGLVPEGRQIFPSLTVHENLVATAASRFGKPRWTLAEVEALFPRLRERRGHLGWQLSGGEQQMLAVGRALMTNPRLLILDEATEGLAPLARQEIWEALTTLKREGQSILLIDKNLDAMMTIADRHVVLEKGHVVWSGTSAELAADTLVKERYLTV